MRASTLRRFAVAALATLLMGIAPSPSRAASGAVNIDLYKASFVVGVAGGNGSLQFAGRRYPLSIGGVSWGASIGVSKAMLIGRVYNIGSASDVAGTYGAVGVGGTVVNGSKIVRLRNEKGAILELQGGTVGLEFSADVSGLVLGLR